MLVLLNQRADFGFVFAPLAVIIVELLVERELFVGRQRSRGIEKGV